MSHSRTSLLPAAMESRLRQIRLRQWIYGSLQVGAITFAAFLLALTMSLLVDWRWMLHDTRLRLALTAGTFVMTAIVAIILMRSRLSPLMKSSWAAIQADAMVPQLEERWTTVVMTAPASHSTLSANGQAMFQQVVHEAAAMGRLVKPRAVARPQSSQWSMISLALALIFFIAVFSSDWRLTTVLWQRFWQPTANITATQLMSQTGDAVIPRGETLEIITMLTGVPRSQAILLMERDNAILETIPIAANSDNTQKFVHRLRVEKPFRYQMQAGDGRTAWHTIRAVDPPMLAEVRLAIDPPAYAHRPRVEKEHIPSRLKVLQGSRLSLGMRPTMPLVRCELAITSESSGAVSKVLVLKPHTDGWYHFETNLEADLTFVPRLWNEYDLTNDDTTACRIQVIPDQTPVARILGSNAEAAVAHDDVMKIEFEAHDDQGLASAQLIVYDESGVENGEPPRILHIQEIPLGNQELQKHVLATVELDLKKLNLSAGSQISYAIRVMDNRMLNLDPQQKSPSLVADRDDDSPANSVDKGTSSNPLRPTGNARRNGDDLQRDMVRNDDEANRETRDDGQTAASATPNSVRTNNGKESLTEAFRADEKSADTTATAHAENPTRSPNMLTDQERSDTAVSALFPDNFGFNAGDPTAASDAIASKTNDDQQRPSRPVSKKPDAGTTESVTMPIAIISDQPINTGTSSSTKTAGSTVKPAGESNKTTSPDGTTASVDDSSTPADLQTPSAQGKPSPNDGADNPVQIVVRDVAERSDSTSDKEDSHGRNMTETPNAWRSPQERPTFLVDLVNGQQDTETTRRRLRITERQAAIAVAKEMRKATLNVREQVVEIDRLLEAIETGLTQVVDRKTPDADRPQHLQQLDQRLGEVEKQIAKVRSETRENQYAFIGLQMVDISRAHVTPAREKVFLAQRETDVGTDRNSTLALQSILRARELLASLLARYDRVTQDQKLADALTETAKMYEVYIEKAQSLLREARQTRNPLERKMAILELDQDYLDRVAEVQRLRREMLAEFAHVLGDDPRLLSRYLQLTKSRRDSLRDQLSTLAERQRDITQEVRGWVQVQDEQREAFFQVIVEGRLQLATLLAKDAAELGEHVEKQLPLVLEPIQGTADMVIKTAQNLTATSRDIALDVRRLLRDPDARISWNTRAQQLRGLCQELEIALDRLNFEHEQQPEVVEYVTARLLETRVVTDHAARWNWIVESIEQKQYTSLAELDQQQVALSTELLRVDMLGIQAGLEAEFAQQEGASIPTEVLELVQQLQHIMEATTFNQSSATFACSQGRTNEAAIQQEKASDQLNRAERLFDEIRRKVAVTLDELPPRNPNIADLRDPSLDEFLAGLEREPNIEAKLGLPDRRQNLRIIADEIEWQENGAGLIGKAAEEASNRAMESQRETERPAQSQMAEQEPSEEERQARAQAEQAQQQMTKMLTEMQQRATDPATSPQERERLDRLSQEMQQLADRSRQGRVPPHLWNQLAQADQTKAALAAIAAGQKIPDQQWNKLMSSLDDGLLQVGGRTPPAEYRRAIEHYQSRLRRLLDGAATKND